MRKDEIRKQAHTETDRGREGGREGERNNKAQTHTRWGIHIYYFYDNPKGAQRHHKLRNIFLMLLLLL